MLRTLAKLLHVLNSETAPGQIALGFALAMVVGLTPLFSVHNLLVLLLVLVLRVNLSAFLLGWVLFTGVAYAVDPMMHALGLAVLQFDPFQDFWTRLYNSPLWRLTRFNNTVVMGGVVLSLFLFFPVLLGCNALVRHYHDHAPAWLRGSRVVSLIKDAYLYRLYASLFPDGPMMRWVRWRGLIVFVAMVAGVAGGIYFFADAMVKRAVETVGSDLNGAEVNVAQARMAFAPFGFTLNDVQVTDARSPMRNAVQIERVRFSLEFLELLRRKVVINDMSVDGVRLNTERATAGARPQNSPKTEQQEKNGWPDLSLPTVDIPSAKELVEREPLQSLLLAQQLRDDVTRAKDEWTKTVTQLPDAQTLAQYDDEWARAKPNLTGRTLDDTRAINESAQRLLALRDKLQRDLDRVADAKHAIAQQMGVWNVRGLEASAAPSADIERLKAKYALDAQGLTNASRVLLGGDIAAWSQIALSWYAKIKPLLARDTKVDEKPPRRFQGLDVQFPERQPFPDFLVRSMAVSVELPVGTVKGQIRNVTTNQPVLGHPLTVTFFAEKMRGVQDVEIEGALNHVNAQATVDSARVRVRGVAVDRFELAHAREFPLVLTHAQADVDAKVQIKEDELTADVHANVNPVQFVWDGDKPGNEFKQAIAQTLGEVKKFQVTAALRGSIGEPKIDVRSDLDEVLRVALNKQFKQRIEQFQSELRARINDRLAPVNRDIAERLADFRGVEQNVEQRRKQVADTLQRAENEVKRQRAAAEAQAQDVVKDEADKLKNRLEGSLKLP